MFFILYWVDLITVNIALFKSINTKGRGHLYSLYIVIKTKVGLSMFRLKEVNWYLVFALKRMD